MIRFLHLLLITFFIITQVSARITDDKSQVLKPIQAIFSAYKPLWENDFKDADLTNLKTLNAIAQKHFLRPANLERKDADQYNAKFEPHTTEAVWQSFKEIGDCDTANPTGKALDYLLINGATINAMRERIEALIKLFPTLTLSPDAQVVFLTGERDLFPEEGEDAKKLSLPEKATESDAAEALWKQTQKPEGLQKLKFTLIRAPKKPNGARPNTFDTMKMWTDTYPVPGHCLSLSSQPYVFYQEQTAVSLFEKLGTKDFTVEGAGYGFEKRPLIAVMLDNLARTIYTLQPKN